MSWEKVFSTSVLQSTLGTKEAAVKAVLGDIFKSIVSILQSQSWIRRAQAVAVLADVLTFVPSGLIAPNTAEVVVSLLRIIPGQMWKGKESVLRVLASLVEKCPQCLDAEASDDVLLRVTPLSVSWGSHKDGSKVKQASGQQEFVVMVNISDMASRSLLLENLSSRLAAYHNALVPASNPAHTNLEATSTAPTAPAALELTFPKCSAWRLSWIGLISLFLQEALRSDRQYRLAAASALSALPWRAMQSPESVSAILPLLPTILDMAGLPGTVTGIHKAVGSSGGDDTGANESGAVAKEERDAGKDVVRRSNYDMFGGRYGGAGADVSTSRAKGTKRARISRGRGEGTGAGGGLGTGEGESKGDEGESADLGGAMELAEEDSAATADTVPLIITATTAAAASEEEEAEEAVAADGVVSNDSGRFQASSSDAAFRVRFLETAAAMWPAYETCLALASEGVVSGPRSTVPPTEDMSLSLFTNIASMQSVPDLMLGWALLVTRHEVWSVRKGMLILLQALVSTGWRLSPSGQSVALLVIESSLDDNKYSQVRAAGATLLLKMLTARCSSAAGAGAGAGSQDDGGGDYVYKTAWSSNDSTKTRVGNLISTLSLDTNPMVISCYSNIQKEWASKARRI
jgi:hypothetical protein